MSTPRCQCAREPVASQGLGIRSSFRKLYIGQGGARRNPPPRGNCRGFLTPSRSPGSGDETVARTHPGGSAANQPSSAHLRHPISHCSAASTANDNRAAAAKSEHTTSFLMQSLSNSEWNWRTDATGEPRLRGGGELVIDRLLLPWRQGLGFRRSTTVGARGHRDGLGVLADGVEPHPEARPLPAEEPELVIQAGAICVRDLAVSMPPSSDVADERRLKGSPCRPGISFYLT